VAALAREIEAAGWDGAFYWDGIYVGPEMPVLDPWVTMAAMALATERVQIGALLTPLSRRRPWKVAREAATLDRLAGGRLVMPVGLGAPDSFGPFGEVTDRRERAELLDEALAILTGLWTGEPFAFSGKHYQFPAVTFLPTPARAGGVPLWVVGALGSERSLARAFRHDGIIPSRRAADSARLPITPDDLRALRAEAAARRGADRPFDIIMEGTTPTGDRAAAAAQVAPLAEAGATWWIESPWTPPNGSDELRARIRQGPPKESKVDSR
jgi:alkanesulfonate monooxygenase SsuD/methylene tetrahydromethanopterin reductase-like flavin-dependent oxidoreductase (luciferase family)